MRRPVVSSAKASVRPVVGDGGGADGGSTRGPRRARCRRSGPPRERPSCRGGAHRPGTPAGLEAAVGRKPRSKTGAEASSGTTGKRSRRGCLRAASSRPSSPPHTHSQRRGRRGPPGRRGRGASGTGPGRSGPKREWVCGRCAASGGVGVVTERGGGKGAVRTSRGVACRAASPRGRPERDARSSRRRRRRRTAGPRADARARARAAARAAGSG